LEATKARWMRRIRVGLAFCAFRDFERWLEVLLEVLLLDLADVLLCFRCWAKVEALSERTRKTIDKTTLIRTATSV
jgi:hypothetical protein